MTDQKPLTDNERLRAFAQCLVEEAASAAARLVELLDSMPAVTAPERIPPLVMRGLAEYRDHGLRPGHFLAGALAGDLFGAMARADQPSMLALPAIVSWIKRELPGDAWGSYAYVDAWCRRARS